MVEWGSYIECEYYLMEIYSPLMVINVDDEIWMVYII